MLPRAPISYIIYLLVCNLYTSSVDECTGVIHLAMKANILKIPLKQVLCTRIGVKWLAQDHNSMAQVGFEPSTLWSGAQDPKVHQAAHFYGVHY